MIYTTSENITWECEKCTESFKKQVHDKTKDAVAICDASKKFSIDRVPPILTIHLKRLSFNGDGTVDKLKDHVEFHDMINLTPYMTPRYDLIL